MHRSHTLRYDGHNAIGGPQAELADPAMGLSRPQAMVMAAAGEAEARQRARKIPAAAAARPAGG
jgi:hypothetical protein